MDTHERPVESQLTAQRQCARACLELAAGELEARGVETDTELGAASSLRKPHHDVAELESLAQTPQRLFTEADDLDRVVPLAEPLDHRRPFRNRNRRRGGCGARVFHL